MCFSEAKPKRCKSLKAPKHHLSRDDSRKNLSNASATIGDQYRNVLFKNPGHGNQFLIVKLVGTQSNRNGVGARIRVTVTTPQGKQTLHRAVGSASSFGGSPLRPPRTALKDRGTRPPAPCQCPGATRCGNDKTTSPGCRHQIGSPFHRGLEP